MTNQPILYDTVIIGGGPGGIATALHLGFHQRKVLVVDRKTSPLQFANTPIHNYPGTTPLHSGVDILRKLRKELRVFNVKTLFGNVVGVHGKVPHFELLIETTRSKSTKVTAKTIVFATGISRKHPKVDGDWKKWLPYAAKDEISYYCPDCDSPLTTGKDIIIVNAGTANSALHVARCIKPYARRIQIFMTEDSYTPFTNESKTILDQTNVKWTHGLIQEIRILDPGKQQQLITTDGRTLECNAFFVAWVGVPRSELAVQMNIEVDNKGNIITDKRGATNLEGVWAVGDVRPITQSIGTAVGTGVYAGIMIAHFLLDH